VPISSNAGYKEEMGREIKQFSQLGLPLLARSAKRRSVLREDRKIRTMDCADSFLLDTSPPGHGCGLAKPSASRSTLACDATNKGVPAQGASKIVPNWMATESVSLSRAMSMVRQLSASIDCWSKERLRCPSVCGEYRGSITTV